MRKEIYQKIENALLLGNERIVKHIDLWNRNVEFIEQETAWERPAVFVEFEPIHWQSAAPGLRYTAEVRVRLHVITDWNYHGDRKSSSALDLTDKIRRALAGLEGDTFKDFDLVESHTNHDHEDIVESVEVYSCVAVMYN